MNKYMNAVKKFVTEPMALLGLVVAVFAVTQLVKPSSSKNDPKANLREITEPETFKAFFKHPDPSPMRNSKSSVDGEHIQSTYHATKDGYVTNFHANTLSLNGGIAPGSSFGTDTVAYFDTADFKAVSDAGNLQIVSKQNGGR